MDQSRDVFGPRTARQRVAASDHASDGGPRFRCISETKQSLSVLGCAVNNVGTNIRKPTVQYTPDDFSHIFSTNVESTYKMCQVFTLWLVFGPTPCFLELWLLLSSLLRI